MTEATTSKQEPNVDVFTLSFIVQTQVSYEYVLPVMCL